MNPAPDGDTAPVRVPVSLSAALAITAMLTLAFGVTAVGHRARRHGHVRRARRAAARPAADPRVRRVSPARHGRRVDRSVSLAAAERTATTDAGRGRPRGGGGRDPSARPAPARPGARPGPVRPRRRVLRDRGPGRGPARRLPDQSRGGAAVRRRRRPGRSTPGGGTVRLARPVRRRRGGRRAGHAGRTVLAAAPGLRPGAALRAGRAVGGAAARCTPGTCGSRTRPWRSPRSTPTPRRRSPSAPTGPICVSLAELPRVAGPAVVAGQRAARQPAVRRWPSGGRRLVRGAGRPRPRAADGRGPPGRAAWSRWTTTGPPLLDRLAPDAADGARVPLQDAARAWLRDALAVAGARGRVVVDRLRRDDGRPGRPPARPSGCAPTGPTPAAGRRWTTSGAQDVTCEVAVDQLALVRPPSADDPPGRVAARRTASTSWWPTPAPRGPSAAHLGDLAALTARSRVTEAEALLDPAGLGGVPGAGVVRRAPLSR